MWPIILLWPQRLNCTWVVVTSYEGFLAFYDSWLACFISPVIQSTTFSCDSPQTGPSSSILMDGWPHVQSISASADGVNTNDTTTSTGMRLNLKIVFRFTSLIYQVKVKLK